MEEDVTFVVTKYKRRKPTVNAYDKLGKRIKDYFPSFNHSQRRERERKQMLKDLKTSGYENS